MKKSPRTRSMLRGFSLVELLVVIGIIAVLVGILMPTIAKVQEQAKGTQCASNLRQLGIALNLYANAWNGGLPTWSEWHPYPHQAWDTQLSWTEELEPYYVSPGSAVYDCPAFPDGYPINYFLEGRWTYLVSTATGNVDHSLKLSEIKMTSRFVISGDCTCGQLYDPPFGNAQVPGTDSDKDDASFEAVVFQNEAGGVNIHSGGNNVLFDDGHVAMYLSFNPQEMTFSPIQMQSWADVTAQ